LFALSIQDVFVPMSSNHGRIHFQFLGCQQNSDSSRWKFTHRLCRKGRDQGTSQV